jgi:hypothetical protein
MVEITVEGNDVVFEVRGWDKVWALRSQLTIPNVHIKDVYVDPEPAMGWFDGLKIAGTAIPNTFRAGTFYQEDEWVFWDVSDPEKTIVIELDHEAYKKLIVEVEDPAKEVKKIRAAMKD